MRPGDVIDDRYEIAARAGSGGMGVVYRAFDRQTGSAVAIKCLSGNLALDAQRFGQEASLLAGFNHPAIVRYVATGRTPDGANYLVMEWLEGQTLNQRLDQHGLTLAETVETVLRVSDGIAFAHRLGVVHRDIKPSNILFPDGDVSRVKIIDFGIALRTQGTVRFTASGTVLGTPSYMAPEQARAERNVDARTDVFSLGCVLFECLTGHVAFAGSNPLAVRAKALVMTPPTCSELAPHVPIALDALVSRMLAKDPDDRPADGGVVAAELAAMGPMPDTLRIRRASDDAKTMQVEDAPTRVSGGAPVSLVSVILAAVPEDYAHLSRPPSAGWAEVKARLLQAAAAFGGRVDEMEGRSHMVVLTAGGSPPEQGAYAARCALAIHAAVPEVAIVLSMGEPDSLVDSIDRGARAMEVAIRRAILDKGLGPGPARPGPIRIDAFAASLLSGEFNVTRAGSRTFYLHGTKATDHGQR